MDFHYYKIDIYKSLEKMLYGFFVYQYFLEASLIWLAFRCLFQVQLLSRKALPMRIAFYVIVTTNLINIYRHCFPVNRHGAIIDFIGLVHPPSKKTLFLTDLQVILIQLLMLVVSTDIPTNSTSNQGSSSDDCEGRTRSVVNPTSPSRASSVGHQSQNNQGSRIVTESGRPSQPLAPYTLPPPPSYITFDAAASSSASKPKTKASSQSATNEAGTAASSSSSGAVLFESSEADGLSDLYDEEPRQQRQSNIHSARKSDSGDEDEEGEEGDALLDSDDYGQVLNDEIFVLQIVWRDTWEYLWSEQAGLAGAVAAAAAARSSSSSSSSDSADSVERLPV